MANLRVASFGLVRHEEVDLMERFQLSPEQLPRVVVFLPGSLLFVCLPSYIHSWLISIR